MSVWRGKVWRMHRFSHKVIIISKNLDGFSLANHGQFAKFTKLSRYDTVQDTSMDVLFNGMLAELPASFQQYHKCLHT